MKKKTVGIIGGLGPDATVDIFKRIVDLTPAHSDEEHLHILIDDYPQIPNRIQAILGDGPSPAPKMIEAAKKLESIGADFLIIPCNTASFYIEKVRKAVNIPVIDIVNQTVEHILANYPNKKNIGVMGTSASMKIGLYQKYLTKQKVDIICKTKHCDVVDEFVTKFKKRYYHHVYIKKDGKVHIFPSNSDDLEGDFEVITPKSETITTLMQPAISGRRGIKAGYKKEPKEMLESVIKELKTLGAEMIILGCTEIPLVITAAQKKWD